MIKLQQSGSPCGIRSLPPVNKRGVSPSNENYEFYFQLQSSGTLAYVLSSALRDNPCVNIGPTYVLVVALFVWMGVVAHRITPLQVCMYIHSL